MGQRKASRPVEFGQDTISNVSARTQAGRTVGQPGATWI